MQTETQTIEDMLQDLAKSRGVLAGTQGNLDDLRDEHMEAFLDAHKDELDWCAEERKRITALEDEIKTRAVAAYEADPSIGKKPYPGIGIRETTTCAYDSAHALDWAQCHNQCLAFDKKAFSDICKSDRLRPEFVVVSKQITATIATDLEQALENSHDLYLQ